MDLQIQDKIYKKHHEAVKLDVRIEREWESCGRNKNLMGHARRCYCAVRDSTRLTFRGASGKEFPGLLALLQDFYVAPGKLLRQFRSSRAGKLW